MPRRTSPSRRAAQAPPDPADAYDTAVRYLANRPRSVGEIHRQLRSKRFDDAAIDSAIDKLRAQRYVDDEAFARYWVEQRERFRPRGGRGLRSELLQKGVSRDVVEVVLGERSPDAEIEQALRSLSRPLARWATLQPDERKRKIHAHLAARGFGYDTIEEVIRREVTEDED